MKFAWARIAIRLIGVLVAAMALPGMVRGLGTVSWMLGSTGWRQQGWAVAGASAEPIGSLIQMAIGLALLFRPQPVLRWCLKDVGRLCTRCGYDIAACTGPACPECGLPLAEVGEITSTKPG